MPAGPERLPLALMVALTVFGAVAAWMASVGAWGYCWLLVAIWAAGMVSGAAIALALAQPLWWRRYKSHLAEHGDLIELGDQDYD